jgi:hypothetical protein
MASIRIFPVERSRRLRVCADVANELAREITDGTENAAGDDVALDP